MFGTTGASIRKFALGVVAVFAILVAGLATGTAAAESKPSTFAAEAAAEGLTASQQAQLQRKVDAVVTTTGGTQIAANKVLWKGGNGATTVVLPGEKRARDLNQSDVVVQAFPWGCPYRAFCTYTNGDFTGDRHDLWSCIDHSTPWYFESWSNNQTRGTVAIFKNSDRREIGRSGPAPSSGRWDFGTTTWYIKPC